MWAKPTAFPFDLARKALHEKMGNSSVPCGGEATLQGKDKASENFTVRIDSAIIINEKRAKSYSFLFEASHTAQYEFLYRIGNTVIVIGTRYKVGVIFYNLLRVFHGNAHARKANHGLVIKAIAAGNQ